MNKITIIIPIHKYDSEIKTMTESLLTSIDKQEGIDYKPTVLIVYCGKIKQPLLDKKYKNIDLVYLVNDGDTSYQSQINFAVNHIKTDYFSVVEFDDELSTKFLRNIDKHIESYPEIDVFLTMIVEVDTKNKPIKLTNELVWSQQFVGDGGEIGYLDDKLLKKYSDFKLSGATIKKSQFINVGGYKTNIELVFMFEFLLRIMNNGSPVYTIPKLLYKHIVGRSGSLFDEYSNNMSIQERKFWFETANKEYLFTNQREIKKTFSAIIS